MNTFEAKKFELDSIWENLIEKLKSYGYVEMASCNKDYSRYLVKAGTESEVTYQGKPELSLRISDHWNWINERKAPGKVQCALSDMRAPYIGEKPVKRACIAVYVGDKYRYLCGERRMRDRRGWIFDTECLESNLGKYLEVAS